MQGAERVAGAQAGPLHHVVVRAAEEPVLPQRELVPGDELAAAGHASETLDVVHFGAGAHHEVVLAEADAALGAFDPVQPARGAGWDRSTGTGVTSGGHCLARKRRLPGHKALSPEIEIGSRQTNREGKNDVIRPPSVSLSFLSFSFLATLCLRRTSEISPGPHQGPMSDVL